MELSRPFLGWLATGFAFGILLGSIMGLMLGAAWGKQKVVKKMKLIACRENLNLDVEKLLQSQLNHVIEEEYL